MLTCIERYYVEKLLLNAELNSMYDLAIFGMGNIGVTLAELLSDRKNFNSEIWHIDSAFSGPDHRFLPFQKSRSWLDAHDQPLTVLVTPVAGHRLLLQHLKKNSKHQYLGYQLADFSNGKRWLDNQNETLFELIKRFPDECYLWDKYKATLTGQQLKVVSQIQHCIYDAASLKEN